MSKTRVYTTLTRVKMALNGGVLPPMTPLTAMARLVIEPSQTIGMGALIEDEERGLRCPVKGCDVWTHNLGAHARSHRAIGGVGAIRTALDIPETHSLLSAREHAIYSQRSKRLANPRFGPVSESEKAQRCTTREARTTARARAAMAVGARNMRDACEAQLRRKFADFRSEYGRRPSEQEFGTAFWPAIGGGYDGRPLDVIHDVYGTWENAVAQLDVVTTPINATLTSEQAVACLRAWWNNWEDLPEEHDVRLRDEFPLLPPRLVILRAMKAESWDEAMRRAASLLNIYGGRYGLPESARATAS